MSERDKVIEAETVKKPQTVDRYFVVYRLGGAYWTAGGPGCATPELAALSVDGTIGLTTFRIVLVRGLPVEQKEGEV